jgi:signal transduction histidine kinase
MGVSIEHDVLPRGTDTVLARGGAMGAMMRAHDWTRTPVGPVETWPQSLRTALGILLDSSYPMYIAWGPSYTQFYNDGYRPILGSKKHPAALGASTRETFAEIWPFIGPMFDRVMTEGVPTFLEDQILPMDRHGYVEECYFTFCYSAIRGEGGGVGGVFVTVVETTARVLGERRLSTLRDLAARSMQAKTVAAAVEACESALRNNTHDLPFSLVYLLEPDGQSARLAAATGLEPGDSAAPRTIPVTDALWPLRSAIDAGSPVAAAYVTETFGKLPSGPWEEDVREVVAVPLTAAGSDRPAGVLVSGASPRRRLDDDYRGFLGLVAGQIAAAVANARAYEEAQERAELLARLDRAKTAFFSNVSHEFRTPLTLLLAPLQEMLDQPEIDADHREKVTLAHRNALRLLKLVNTLLDFSRVEAGRVDAAFEPTDLAALTTDLASTFRSAVERAGLTLTVDCPRLDRETSVDRDMWEKVVLNLLSNAFKHTFQGGIEVRLRATGDAAELTVGDTGVGIPDGEVDRVFERFHRVAGSRARTHEGTGIGLALVRELVAIHGGTTGVASQAGTGTTFTVRIPFGSAHLPADRLRTAGDRRSTATGAMPYVEEALRWLPEASTGDAASANAAPSGVSPTVSSRVLVADDNADMRDYVARLLRRHGWIVSVAVNGREALDMAVAQHPDLVLADVMMPELDGFALLEALRKHDSTALVPVILLSARAGEEARVEGLAAGADDYLVKPFAAQELVARVGAHLALDRERRRFADAERAARQEADAARAEAERANRAKTEFLATMSHELRTPLNAIAGYVELLQLGIRGPLTPQQREDLQRISRSQRHLLALINDVLNFARLESGKLELALEPVPIAPLLADLDAMVRNQAAAKDLSYETSACSESIVALGDEESVRQILLNLATNAVKYTDRGGRVMVSSAPDEGWVDVVVSDTGRGIPAPRLDAIFEPFVQLARPRTSASEHGIGLGLAISRDLARSMNGDVLVESTEGVGSRFTLRLPRVQHPG